MSKKTPNLPPGATPDGDRLEGGQVRASCGGGRSSLREQKRQGPSPQRDHPGGRRRARWSPSCSVSPFARPVARRDSGDAGERRHPPGLTADGAVRFGSDDAPVVLQAVEDFQCPVCRQFEARTGDLLPSTATAGTWRWSTGRSRSSTGCLAPSTPRAP